MTGSILENLDAIDTAKSDWLLELATAKLKATYDISCDLDKKATALLAGCTALLCAGISYGFSHKDANNSLVQHVIQTGWLWAGVLCIGVGALVLLWQLATSNIHVPGCLPSTLMNGNDGYVRQSLNDMKNGYLTEMELRLQDNLEWTRNRTHWIDFAIVIISVAPFVSAVAATIITK